MAQEDVCQGMARDGSFLGRGQRGLPGPWGTGPVLPSQASPGPGLQAPPRPWGLTARLRAGPWWGWRRHPRVSLGQALMAPGVGVGCGGISRPPRALRHWKRVCKHPCKSPQSGPSRRQVTASNTDANVAMKASIQETPQNFRCEGAPAPYRSILLQGSWSWAGAWCLQLKRLRQSFLNCSWSSEVICLPGLETVLCLLKDHNNQLYPNSTTLAQFNWPSLVNAEWRGKMYT